MGLHAPPADPGNDPARLSVEEPGELNRWLPLKWLLVIPNLIVLAFVGVGAFFVCIYAFFATLITGRWPAGARDFVIGTLRWSNRATAYYSLMTDAYPPFSLQ